jgi:hypothetical protein
MTPKRSLTPSSLGSAQGKTPMNEEEMEKEAERIYHTTGSVLIFHSMIPKLDGFAQIQLAAIAAQLFGQRKQK